MEDPWFLVLSTLPKKMFLVNEANINVGDEGNGNKWKDLGMLLFSIGMVFGPHIGYVFQMHNMRTTRNIKGYSSLASFILLTSNSIRVLYYVGRAFALALLFQAIFAILVHTVMLTMIMRMTQGVLSDAEEGANGGGQVGDNTVQDFPPPPPPPAVVSSFRNGTSTVIAEDLDLATWGGVDADPSRSCLSRLEEQTCRLERALLSFAPAVFLKRYIMSTLVVVMVVLFYYASVTPLWGAAPDVVGYIALGIEALLVFPQILHNHRRESTEGLTIVLVLTWLFGDIVKVTYFFVDKQPFPFLLCGCFQLLLDVVVIGQVIYYRIRRRRVPVAVVVQAEEISIAMENPQLSKE